MVIHADPDRFTCKIFLQSQADDMVWKPITRTSLVTLVPDLTGHSSGFPFVLQPTVYWTGRTIRMELSS